MRYAVTEFACTLQLDAHIFVVDLSTDRDGDDKRCSGDTCYGDSGIPVVARVPGDKKIVKIVIFQAGFLHGVSIGSPQNALFAFVG